jgi:hypothetical protein
MLEVPQWTAEHIESRISSTPIADLQRLAAALNPRKLVPIHTERCEDFSRLFANVVTLNDGEVFELA